MLQNIFHTNYNIAGIALEVRSDLPLKADTFAPKFAAFENGGQAEDKIVLTHHFEGERPPLSYLKDEPLYRNPPWAVYSNGTSIIYEWIKKEPPFENYYQTVVTDEKHTFLDIYNDASKKSLYLKGGCRH